MKNKILLILCWLIPVLGMAQVKTVILPERFQHAKILVVNSPEFKDLVVKNKQLASQLQVETSQNSIFAKKIDEQAAKNQQIQSELLNDFNSAKLQINKQSATIAKIELKLVMWRIYFFALLGLIILYFVAKVYLSSAFPFPKLIP